MKINIVRFPCRLAAYFAVCLFLHTSLFAQDENDSIHISVDFLKELDNTFGFQHEKPRIAHINTIEAIKPDSELLHQWVKDPNAHGIATVSKYPMTVNIPGLSNGEFAKGIVVWRSKNNPDLMLLNTGNGIVASGLDINGFLSQYLTQEGRTLRKSRDLSKSCKEIMDKFFPIDGNALFSKDDSIALTNQNRLARE
jgi:hypothetical protein